MKRKTQENKIKRQFKSKQFIAQKGITLIALVVTIVVLLILAGVSINLVLGDNGIISKSKESRDATRYGSIMDEYELYKASEYIDRETGETEDNSGFSDFLISLKSKGLIDDDDIAQINSENKLTISDKYEISFAKTLYQALQDGEIQIGDYVNYTPDAGKTYTSNTSENGWTDQTYTVDTSTQWRILGTEGESVLLVSADPIKKDMNVTPEPKVRVSEDTGTSSGDDWNSDPYLYMKGAYGYVNCKTMLNNICGIYSNSLGTARSMTIDDINNALGVEVKADGVYQKDNPTTNIDELGFLGSGDTFTFNGENGITPESYAKHAKSGLTESSSEITQMLEESSGKVVPSSEYPAAYFYAWAGIDGYDTLKEILFDGTLPTDNFAKSYWLASPEAHGGSGAADFGPGGVGYGAAGSGSGMFDSGGYWYAGRFAVRPVVTLKSDVTVEQIKKITGSTEKWTWDNSNPNAANGNLSDGEAGNHGGVR